MCFWFLCVFARSEGGNVEKYRVCRKVSCFCMFLLGPRGGNVEKCCVFVCVVGKLEKCRVFVCFWFLCVFARSNRGNVEKGRVCQKVSCFCVFSG